MTYNVFGGMLNPAQSNPWGHVLGDEWAKLHHIWAEHRSALL